MPAFPPAIGAPNAVIISSHSRTGVGMDIGALASAAPSSVAHGTNNLARAFPIYLSEPAQVLKVWWFNGATAAGNVDVGVYKPDGARQFACTATAQAGINALQEVDITDVYLPRGLYYCAISCSLSTATLFSCAFNLHFAKGMGWWQMATAHPLPDPATFAAYATAIEPYFGLSLRVVTA